MDQPQNVSGKYLFLIALRDIQLLDGCYGLLNIADHMRVIRTQNQIIGTDKGVSAHEGGFKKTDGIVIKPLKIIPGRSGDIFLAFRVGFITILDTLCQVWNGAA